MRAVAALAIPQCEPWVVNRWAFRTLLERAATLVSDPADEHALRQSVALDGLDCAQTRPSESLRQARAIERAADLLRDEFREGTDAREREFADRLDVVRLNLSDLTSSAP